jgi:hypothetical protein
MNEAMNKLQDTTSIASRAMKFKLSRGGTKRRVRDKDAEALLKNQLGDEGQIVSRELFKGKNKVSEYQGLANEMHGYHVKATLPFGDDSSRVLLNTNYFDYTTKMNNYISQLAQFRYVILASWDQLVQDDINSRNNALTAAGNAPLAKVSDYPTRHSMENRLYVTWFPEPISTVNDFRFDLPADMLEVVDKQFADMIETASRERFTRMLNPVSAFIGKLEKDTGVIYSGCFVNAQIDIWAQDNGFGKRINCTLAGVQFAADGDAFGGGRPASADDFDDLGDLGGADADDFS